MKSAFYFKVRKVRISANHVQWRILRTKIFLISCIFWENLANLYVGAPSYEDSWIRPCFRSNFFHFQAVFGKKFGKNNRLAHP